MSKDIKRGNKPRSCSQCGSTKIAEILYGEPAFSDKLHRDIKLGKIVLGGCVVGEDDPIWQCVACGTAFSKAKSSIRKNLRLKARDGVKLVRRKRRGFVLEAKTFNNKDGVTYLVFRTPNGSYHVFAEVEAKKAAIDCGAVGTSKDNTRQLWERLWKPHPQSPRVLSGDEPPQLTPKDEAILDEVWAAVDLGVDDIL